MARTRKRARAVRTGKLIAAAKELSIPYSKYWSTRKLFEAITEHDASL